MLQGVKNKILNLLILSNLRHIYKIDIPVKHIWRAGCITLLNNQTYAKSFFKKIDNLSRKKEISEKDNLKYT